MIESILDTRVSLQYPPKSATVFRPHPQDALLESILDRTRENRSN
jgi:hypothetical protein